MNDAWAFVGFHNDPNKFTENFCIRTNSIVLIPREDFFPAKKNPRKNLFSSVKLYKLWIVPSFENMIYARFYTI